MGSKPTKIKRPLTQPPAVIITHCPVIVAVCIQCCVFKICRKKKNAKKTKQNKKEGNGKLLNVLGV